MEKALRDLHQLGRRYILWLAVNRKKTDEDIQERKRKKEKIECLYG